MVERADLISILKEGAGEVEWNTTAVIGEVGTERGIKICLKGEKEEVVRPDLIIGRYSFSTLTPGLIAYMIKLPMECSRAFGIACTQIPS